MIHFVGDVHGRFEEFSSILGELPEKDTVIQLGDLGVGFGRDNRIPLNNNFRFIRGNHDNPSKCLYIPSYLGDYGYIEQTSTFFISGAYSVDQNQRTQGVDWWHDEELTYIQAGKAAALYEKKKPSIVVSHDCPYEMLEYIAGKPFRTGTTSLLSAMFMTHEPKFWFFGHHHRSMKLTINNTVFVALKELEVVHFDEIKKEIVI